MRILLDGEHALFIDTVKGSICLTVHSQFINFHKMSCCNENCTQSKQPEAFFERFLW